MWGTELKVGSKGRDQAGGSLAFLETRACLPSSSLQPHPQEEEVAGPILQVKKPRLMKEETSAPESSMFLLSCWLPRATSFFKVKFLVSV